MINYCLYAYNRWRAFVGAAISRPLYTFQFGRIISAPTKYFMATVVGDGDLLRLRRKRLSLQHASVLFTPTSHCSHNHIGDEGCRGRQPLRMHVIGYTHKQQFIKFYKGEQLWNLKKKHYQQKIYLTDV